MDTHSFRRMFLICAVAAAAVLPLPVRAATGTPAAAVSQAAVKNGLVKEKGGLRCYRKGVLLKNTWKKVSGKTYYFNKKGYAVSGSVKISGTYYVFQTSCRLLTPAKTAVKTVAGVKYRVSPKGKAVPGWDASKTYYYAKNGARVTNGWTADGKYYLNGKGKKTTGVTVLTTVKKDEFGLDMEVSSFTAFGKNGVKDAALTKKIRKAAVPDKNMKTLLSLIGKPVSTEYLTGCSNGPEVNGEYPYAGGDDGTLIYKSFIVYTYRAPDGTEFFVDVKSR